MRNLKKFLALVLAMMMTLSLMITVNAKDITADFTDAESVTEDFQEGVDVLNGMKVFEGYTDGSFQPKGLITRAEVATIVYRLATGDWEGIQAHLYKDYEKFTDVNGDHWAAGYINYCANAEWIAGYGNGKFGPNDQVTGYQAAAMILRAVGYGKNNEFVGPTWQVQVANVTRSEGLLTNVDNTTYANTLNRPATRELVAEILFQAAQIPTVTWTMLGGYNKYQDLNNITGNDNYNPSLGWTNYGLTWDYGTVVDNQETKLNEDYTTFNIASYAGGVVTYQYDTGDIRLNLQTELKDFGRAYLVWYNGKGAATTKHTVYAAYDQSTAYEVVFDNSTTGTDGANPSLAAPAAGQTNLGSIAQSVGFKLNSSTDAYVSNGYADFYTRAGVVTRGNEPYESPQHMYVLLSNSSNKTLDVVISLNVEATKITAVNSNVTNKTINTAYWAKALNNYSDSITNIESTDFVSTHTNAGGTKDVAVDLTTGGSNSPATMAIYQSKLTGNSSTTFQDYVISNAIMADSNSAIAGGTTNIIAYNTKAAMEKKTGTVTAFHVNTTWNNADPDYVMVDGEKIEKSVLYMTVPTGNTSGTNLIIPQVGDGVPANEQYTNAKYEFYLDGDGKYIGAKLLGDDDFIYGTYVDYSQELSTSTFNYFMTGVDKDGKVITKQVSQRNGQTINSVQIIGETTYPLPYRNTTANSVNGLGEGVYSAFNLRGGNARTVGQLATTDLYFAGMLGQVFDDPVIIDNTVKTLGAVDVDADNSGNTVDNNLYFTENTKFILVEGFGTDSLKTEVYKGVSELLGSRRNVRIDLTGGAPAGNSTDGYEDQVGWYNMTYMETSPFIYSQTVGVDARQADLIILPKAAVSFGSETGLYYVGDTNPTLFNADGAIATRFTMYDAAGNKVDMWVEGDSRVATTDGTFTGADPATSAHIIANTWTGNTPGAGWDKFYELVPTGKTTVGGETIYRIGETNAANDTYIAHSDAWSNHYPTAGTITATTGSGAKGTYVATVMNTQLATIFTDQNTTFNVANAKVVNLANTGSAATLSTRYPGISDLATLNASASVNANLKVSAVVSNDNNMIVTTIFVAYNQN